MVYKRKTYCRKKKNEYLPTNVRKNESKRKQKFNKTEGYEC